MIKKRAALVPGVLSSRRWVFTAFLCAVLSPPATTIAQTFEVLHTFILDGASPTSSPIQGSDGYFYGTTTGGGANNAGAVYRTDSKGNLVTVHSFSGPTDGADPAGGLLQASDGNFYGTTGSGGANNFGTTFKLDPSGTLTTLHSFAGDDGYGPTAALIEAADGDLYGTTLYGGTGDLGTVFRMDFSGNVTPLHLFAGSDGANPQGGLIQAADGDLYGTTSLGGASAYGTVFKIDSSGNLTTLHSFVGSDGAHPAAGLIQGLDGDFYGTTSGGGTDDGGTIFKIDSSGNLTTLRSLSVLSGWRPLGGLVQSPDGTLYGTTSFSHYGFGTAFKMDLQGNLTWLHTFQSYEGATPSAGLVRSANGDFYGTTISFGFNYGSLFKIDSAGTFTVLHLFGFSEGTLSYSGVTQAADGSLYGTTYGGGSQNDGTIFKLDPSGKLTTLHTFWPYETPLDGSYPTGGLILGTDGNLYGTTDGGGANNGGIVYKTDPKGAFSVLYSFYGHPGDALNPFGSLLRTADGSLYGTTVSGGTNGQGAVFKIDPAGAETVLHSFAGYPDEGASPFSAPILASDGAMYGTTMGGGDGNGSVYRVDPSGGLTTIHLFDGSDGGGPSPGLIQATDGNLYGTTDGGGSAGFGTIFKMNLSGHLTTLYNFSLSDGANPRAGLVQSADGNFYGTTSYGGTSFDGTIFRMDSSGNVTVLRNFSGPDGASPYAALTQGVDGALYGTALGGGAGGGYGVVYRLAACSPAPAPSVDVTRCLPALTSGFVASVPGKADDGYAWTLGGGTIDAGQGTNAISFTSGSSGTLMNLSVVETNASGCAGSARQSLLVDFADEPPSDPFYAYVCAVGRARVSSGCGEGNFCPAASVTRAQMAILLLKAELGGGYLPPPCTGVFEDVPCPGGFAVDWIEQLYNSGITGGCSVAPHLYCPGAPVNRAQLAVFLLKAEHGSTYVPPACTGIFGDVTCAPTPAFAVDWIEQLFNEKVTGGCGTNDYCPSRSATRAQMAVFLAKAFGL